MRKDLSGVHINDMTMDQKLARISANFLALRDLQDHTIEVARLAVNMGSCAVLNLDKKWVTKEVAELVFNSSDTQKKKALESLKKRQKELKNKVKN